MTCWRVLNRWKVDSRVFSPIPSHLRDLTLERFKESRKSRKVLAQTRGFGSGTWAPVWAHRPDSDLDTSKAWLESLAINQWPQNYNSPIGLPELIFRPNTPIQFTLASRNRDPEPQPEKLDKISLDPFTSKVQLGSTHVCR